MKVTVYTPASFCPKCFLVKKTLERKEVEYEAKVSDENDVKYFQEKGYHSYPVTVVSKDDDTIEEFVGADRANLDNLIQAVEEQEENVE